MNIELWRWALGWHNFWFDFDNGSGLTQRTFPG